MWTFDSSGIQALPDFASTWKDRGFWLLPDFARVSQKKEPTNFISCLLPTMDDTQRSTPFDPSPSSVTHKDQELQDFQDIRSRGSSPEAIPFGCQTYVG